jgi:hypothetical protein
MKNAVFWNVTSVTLLRIDVSEERIASIITVLQAGESLVRFSMPLEFSVGLTFQPHYGPRGLLCLDRNKYQKSSWTDKGRHAVA